MVKDNTLQKSIDSQNKKARKQITKKKNSQDLNLNAQASKYLFKYN